MRTLYRGGSVYSPDDPFATALVVDGATVAWIGSDEAAGAARRRGRTTSSSSRARSSPRLRRRPRARHRDRASPLGGRRPVRAPPLGGRDPRARSRRPRAPAAAARARARLGRADLAEGRPPTRAELDRASCGRRGLPGAGRLALGRRLQRPRRRRPGARDHAGWTEDGPGRARRAPRRPRRRPRTGSRRRPARAQRAGAAGGRRGRDRVRARGVGPAHRPGGRPARAGRARRPATAGEPLPEVVPYRGQLVADEAQAREVVERLGVPLAGLAGDLNADGAVGSRTASLRAPYADAPATSGHTYLRSAQVRDHVVACTAAGAAGRLPRDRRRRRSTRSSRGSGAPPSEVGIAAVRAGGHRLEHVETPDADAVARLADLGLTASVQPAFDAAWGGPSGMYAAAPRAPSGRSP